MSSHDTATVPALGDLQPADPHCREEIRTLAGIVVSVIGMTSSDARTTLHADTIDRALAEPGRPEGPMRIAMLLVPLINVDCRAAACARIGTSAGARAHLDLWLWVARHTLDAPPEVLPFTVAGFAAARAGFTPLALECLDRALAKPGLDDARAYRDALTGGTPGERLRPHYPMR